MKSIVKLYLAKGRIKPFLNITLIAVSLIIAQLSYSQTTPLKPEWANMGQSAEAKGMTVDSAGNSYIIGHYSGSALFQGDSKEDTLNAVAGSDIFIAKYDDAGKFLWAKSFGGSQDDIGLDIEWDTKGGSNGELYITGSTFSADFPITPGAFDATYNGNGDAFIAIIDEDDATIIYSTYVGSNGFDEGKALEYGGYSPAHNERWLFITGETDSTGFPVSDSATDPTYNGMGDAFLFGLLPGAGEFYGSYYGGSDKDIGIDLARVNTEYAWDTIHFHIVGHTRSVDFPTVAWALDQTQNGGYDIFSVDVQCINGSLVHSTYIGGSNDDFATAIEMEYFPDISWPIIVGSTFSQDFPVSINAYYSVNNGGEDGLFLKFDHVHNLSYATYFGGPGNDVITGVAVDQTSQLFDDVFLIGETDSTSAPFLPKIENAFDTIGGSVGPGFMVRFKEWSLEDLTFFGEDYLSRPREVIRLSDKYGSAKGTYVTGSYCCGNLNLRNDTLKQIGPGDDVFLVKLDSVGPDTCTSWTIADGITQTVYLCNDSLVLKGLNKKLTVTDTGNYTITEVYDYPSCGIATFPFRVLRCEDRCQGVLDTSFCVGFNHLGSWIAQDWEAAILNPDADEKWMKTSRGFSEGTGSSYINNYNVSEAGHVDALITPSIDLTTASGPQLTFDLAYEQGQPNATDQLRVYVSTDCGLTWVMRYSKSGATLATTGNTTTLVDFVPGLTDWRQETISLQVYAGQASVGVKFEFTSGNGSNVYIDNICYGDPGLCQSQDCVWPGDADDNGTANIFDLLPIGIAYSTIGNTRSNATINWEGQVSIDWPQSFPAGVNYKHADCDGNGTIDVLDLPAIIANYGKSHNKTNRDSKVTLADPELFFENLPDTVFAGQTLTIPIGFGTNSLPVDSIYGMVFSIDYDPDAVDSAYVSFDNSWLGTLGGDAISLSYFNTNNSTVDAGMVRTDGFNRGGFGTFGELSIIMKDDISGKVQLAKVLNMSFSNVKAIFNNEDELLVYHSKDSIIAFDPDSGVDDPDLKSQLRIFPNPAKENVRITMTSGIQIESVAILDLTGREVMNRSVMNHTSVLDLTKLPAGVHFIQVQTERGNTTKKLLVVE